MLFFVSEYVSTVLQETAELLERKMKPFFESGVTPDWAENTQDEETLKGHFNYPVHYNKMTMNKN